VVIVIMVVLSVITAFIQEHRSNEAAARLRAMVKTTASVKRLEASDLRLLDSKDLFINQSTLSGEAMPAEKHAQAGLETIDDPFDLPNVCFMGSNVVSGYATGVILRTGGETFFGQLADQVAGRDVPTAFDRGVTRFSWLMIRW
jgi:P-type Mg2+ transporter